jgi:BASS family bile acid:Na+ symporter
LAGLIGQIVFLPVIAFLVGKLFGIEPIFFLGIMLIGCSPGGSSSNVFSMLAGGDVALSVSLTAFSSVITLFTSPLIMDFVASMMGNDVDVHLPVGNLLVQNIVLMAVPIAIGLLIAVYKESFAQKLHAVLKRLAFPLLILLASVFFIQNRETIIEEFPKLGLTITILILLSMLSGILLSWLMQLTRKEQRTIVIEIGMQNAAQAITIASSPFVFNNDIMAIPAIVYALMMNVILLIYVGVLKGR